MRYQAAPRPDRAPDIVKQCPEKMEVTNTKGAVFDRSTRNSHSKWARIGERKINFISVKRTELTKIAKFSILNRFFMSLLLVIVKNL